MICSPDGFSRKYAYPVLRMEELRPHGVEVIFTQSPYSHTKENQLLSAIGITGEGYRIDQVAKRLNAEGVATRSGVSRGEPSTVWGLLRKPTYVGKAGFGKTERAEWRKITHGLRQWGGVRSDERNQGLRI